MMDWQTLGLILVSIVVLEVVHFVREWWLRLGWEAVLEAERQDRRDLMDRIQAKDLNEYKRHTPPVVVKPVQDKDKDVITPL